MSDPYLDALLVERAGKVGNADALAAIDAEIERVGGVPPADPVPAGPGRTVPARPVPGRR